MTDKIFTELLRGANEALAHAQGKRNLDVTALSFPRESVNGGAATRPRVSTFLASVLFGVTPHDPWTLSGVAAAQCVASLVAVVIPAVRAASTDPVVTIRQE